MHVVIAGCGRVGSQLAVVLDEQGHEVVIIDKNPLAFRRLGERYGGRKLPGIVFDRATLEDAGIRRAGAFVAVTSGDNSNIVSARTAHERFGVERVVARIHDPERALIYERTGITTIASAQWTAEAVLRELLPQGERVDGALGPGQGDVVLITLPVAQGVHGGDVAMLNSPGRWLVAAITRGGTTTVPVAGALVESGDTLHLAVAREAVEAARAAVGALGEAQR